MGVRFLASEIACVAYSESFREKATCRAMFWRAP